MEFRPLARFLTTAAASLVGAAFLAGSVVPAAVGFAMMSWLLYTRWAAHIHFARVEVRLARAVLEAVHHEGQPVQIELDATLARRPPGVEVIFEDLLPSSLRPTGPTAVRSGERRIYVAVPTSRGIHVVPGVRASLEDTRGLWRAHREIPLLTEFYALAPREAMEAGRRLARRTPLEARTRSAVGLLIRDLEFETIRPYAAGDRLRDLDWRRFAKYLQPMTKTWVKEREAAVIVCLDAGRTMRARRGSESKLDHAARLVLELATAAGERSYRVGYLAFADREVLDEMTPSRGKEVPRKIGERLARLPGHIQVRRRLEVGLPGQSPTTDSDLDFLEKIGGLRGRTAAPGPAVAEAFGRVLHHAGGDKRFVVLFTDLETLPDSTLRSIASAASSGHRVIAVVLPGSRFLGRPEVVRPQELEAAYSEAVAVHQARARLQALGVKLLEMDPGSTAAPITAASHSFTSARRRVR